MVITSLKTYKENGEYETTPEPKFEPFTLIDPENFEFLVLKDPLSHEAFTSTGVIRNVYSEQIFMDDSISGAWQFETYLELNQELLNFFKESETYNSTFFREVNLKKSPNKD